MGVQGVHMQNIGNVYLNIKHTNLIDSLQSSYPPTDVCTAGGK